MNEAVQKQAFSYFRIITGMLGRPGNYLSASLSDQDVKTPVIFLLISTVFYSSASLTVLKGNLILSAGILALNAFVMPLVNAVVSFFIIRLLTTGNAGFIRVYSIHAFAAGTVLLAAWIPMIIWITEPWKWILITVGYVKGCGMRYPQAIFISMITVGFIISVFQFLINIII